MHYSTLLVAAANAVKFWWYWVNTKPVLFTG